MRYAVAGIPRSRTAWLSVFLSQSGIYCHHDGINGCSSIRDYRKKTRGCGDSTTGFMFCGIRDMEIPKLVISKSPRELERSIEYCIDLGSTREAVLKQYDYLMSFTGSMIVPQSKIDGHLATIFEHLTKMPYKDIYGDLKKFNIQSPDSNIDTKAMMEFLNVQ